MYQIQNTKYEIENLFLMPSQPQRSYQGDKLKGQLRTVNLFRYSALIAEYKLCLPSVHFSFKFILSFAQTARDSVSCVLFLFLDLLGTIGCSFIFLVEINYVVLSVKEYVHGQTV